MANLSHQVLWGEYGPGDATEWTPFFNREKSMGRTFDIYHKFASFDTTFSGHSEWLAAAQAGRKIAITWEPRTVAGVNWTAIRDGTRDSYIATQINYLTANYPTSTEIIIRFGHEMNANWYPWNPAYNQGTIQCASTQIYRDTWAHVREYVRTLNPNIKFWWCPNVKDSSRVQVNQLTNTCAGTGGAYTITIPADPGVVVGDCVFEVDAAGNGLPEANSRVGTDTRVLQINGLTLTVSIANKSTFTNARLGFAHTAYPMEDFFPGTQYVDYIGYDAYNALDGSAWYTAAEITQGHTDTTHPMQTNAYTRVTALHPTAPVWIGETGCADYDPTLSLFPHGIGVTIDPCPTETAKAEFYTALFTLDKTALTPRLGAVCFYDRPKDAPYSYTDTGSLYWSPDSTAGAWAAYISPVSGFAQPAVLSSVVFNVAKGAVLQITREQLALSNGTDAFGVLLLKAADTDEILRDYDTVAALLAGGVNAEATFSNYARKIFKVGDSPNVAYSVDDSLDQVRVTMPNITWASAGAGQGIVKVVVYQVLGADSVNVPLVALSLVTETTGGDLLVAFPSGIFGGT